MGRASTSRALGIAEVSVVFLGLEVDAAFPIVHGTWGEDGTLQGLLEMFDIPYVGCNVAASAVAMDKGLAKSVLSAAGVPVVDGEVVTRAEVGTSPAHVLGRIGRLPMPLFVKPCIGGSSVGVKKVVRTGDVLDALEHALMFDDRVVVERGVDGRELECAVLGYETFEASAIGEIEPGREFYDYADKYLEDGARLHAPAELPTATSDRLRELAIEAFAAIGGAGLARVDFLLEANGDLFVNEINSLPGFTDISMYPRLWEVSGLPIPGLVDRLVSIAIRRHADRKRLDQGIKGFIASIEH